MHSGIFTPKCFVSSVAELNSPCGKRGILHVRELARLTGVPAGSLHRELALLSRIGRFSTSPRARTCSRWNGSSASPS